RRSPLRGSNDCRSKRKNIARRAATTNETIGRRFDPIVSVLDAHGVCATSPDLRREAAQAVILHRTIYARDVEAAHSWVGGLAQIGYGLLSMLRTTMELDLLRRERPKSRGS